MIKIAVPNKGSLSEAAVEILREAGIENVALITETRKAEGEGGGD